MKDILYLLVKNKKSWCLSHPSEGDLGSCLLSAQAWLHVCEAWNVTPCSPGRRPAIFWSPVAHQLTNVSNYFLIVFLTATFPLSGKSFQH
jgi:hypothetical protein